MAVTSNFKEVFKRIGDRLKQAPSPENLKKLGEAGSEMIRVRTRLGYGVRQTGGKRAKLKPLSALYKESREEFADLSEFTTPARSNLTLTGQMLESIGILKIERTSVEIGPKGPRRSEPLTNQKVAEYVSGARPFLFLSDLEIKKLARFYEKNIIGKIFRR